MTGNAWKAFAIQNNLFEIKKTSTLTFTFHSLDQEHSVEGNAICLEEDLSEDTYSGSQVRILYIISSCFVWFIRSIFNIHFVCVERPHWKLREIYHLRKLTGSLYCS